MHSALVTALTVADRGPGSIRHISPNTSPGPSVLTVLAFASLPTLTSTEPEPIRNACLRASPSEIIVSRALNWTVCIDVTSKTADNSFMAVGGMIGQQALLEYRAGIGARIWRH